MTKCESLIYKPEQAMQILKKRCKEKDLRYVTVAESLGYAESRLAMYFSGKTLPRIEAFINLAHRLDMAVMIYSECNVPFSVADITDYKDLYQELTEYRKACKISYKMLGESTGRRETYYSSVFSYKRSMRLDIFLEMLSVLNLRLDLVPTNSDKSEV